MEVRLLKHSSLSIDLSSVVNSNEVLGSSIDVAAISGLSRIHVSSGLTKTELSLLHLGLKLSSVGSRVGGLDVVSLMSSIRVSLEVRSVVA